MHALSPGLRPAGPTLRFRAGDSYSVTVINNMTKPGPDVVMEVHQLACGHPAVPGGAAAALLE